MSQRIDELILLRLGQEGLRPSEPANDAEFLRRAYLDLAGVNPEPSAAIEYFEDSSADKRLQLLQTLIRSPNLSVRLADEWTQMLVAENLSDPTSLNARESLRRWLHQKFSDNTRYDRIVSDLLIATGDPTEQPTAFFTALEFKPEKLAEKTSRVFLGVALDCAQCHDHPFDKWKQPDFWGVAAYFAQVSGNNMDQPNRMAALQVVDQTTGEVTIPETTTIVAPKPLLNGLETTMAIGSRRQQLAIWVTSKQNEWFARAAVNRTWALLMGRGLIEPVDDMSGKAVPSHPELLTELATFFRKSGYDIKKLMLAIVCSDAYARSSRDAKVAESQFYANMLPKPLTSRQLTACLRQVSRQSARTGMVDEWDALSSELGPVRADGSEFVGGVLQSLLIQNSKLIERIWDQSSSKLLKALAAPHLAIKDRIQWMYLATLSRLPTDMEINAISNSIEGESGQSGQSNATWEADLLWAILNSSEFAFTP